MQRAGEPLTLSDEMTSWYQAHLAKPEDKSLLAGSVWPVTLTQLAISATTIRSDITLGQPPAFLTPDPVVSFIEQLKLYQ